MELSKRIKSRLSEATDWNAVLDQLESEANAAGDAAAQSKAFFDAGCVFEGVILDRARAMQAFQKAFKLDQKNLIALQYAREIYQWMAHLEMVTRLMGLELRANRDPARAGELNYCYGRALLNLRKVDQARPFLEVAASDASAREEYNDRFQETLYDRGNWQFALQNVYNQLIALTGQNDPLAADVAKRGHPLATLYMKAARILQQESPEDQRLLPLLFKALDANPLHEEAAFVAEVTLAASGHLQHIQKLQDRRASLVDDVAEKTRLLRGFATVWQVRLNNIEMAAYFYRQSLEYAFAQGQDTLADERGHAWHVGAFHLLKLQAEGRQSTDGLVELAARGLTVISVPQDAAMIALEGAELAWRFGNDVDTARHLFSQAAEYAGGSPRLQEFVAAHGPLGAAPSRAAAEKAAAEKAAAEKAAAEKAAADKAAAEKAAADKAAADKAAAEKAAAEQAAADQAAAEQAAAEQAAAEQAAADRAAADQAAAEQAAEDAAARAAADEAAAEQAAADREAADRAAAEQAERDEAQAAADAEAARVAAEQAAAEQAARDEEAAAARAAAEEAAAEKAAADQAAAEAAAAERAEAERLAAEKAAADKAAAQQAAAERAASAGAEETFTPDELDLIRGAQEAEAQGGTRAIDAWRDVVHKLPEKRYPKQRLKELYVEAGKWSNVADLLKDDIKSLDDHDPRKRDAYWELVTIYDEHLRQPGLVVTTLSSLEKLLEDVGDTAALLKVVEVQQQHFEKMKRWPDLISRIRRRAELTDDPKARAALHLEAGNLFLDKFNNQAEAIKSYESVLETDEFNVDAIAKLKDLYARRRDWEKMVSVQQKELSLIEDTGERLNQLLEIARTAVSKIKKNSLSIELWNEVLTLDSANYEALEQLEGLLEREKDWAGLASVLNTLTDVEKDSGKRVQHLIKLGQLYADKVNDNKAAIKAWEALYEIDPENRRAQDALKKLYLAEGALDSLEEFYAKQDKWGEFVRVLERESESAEGETRTNLLIKISDLYRTHLDKADRAMRALEKALSFDENSLPAAIRLIDLYEAAADERNIAKPLEVKLAHTEDPGERLVLLRRLADLAERIAGDQVQAFAYFRQALKEDHTVDDARQQIERLAADTNQWAALVESFEAAIEKYADDPASIPMRLTVAAVYEARIGDLDAALAANQAVLRINPEEPTALDSLERLFLALGREEDLLAVLATKLSLAADDEERRAIHTRSGAIQEQLGHDEQAIAAYEAVLAMGVEDPNVLAALDRMYLRLERWNELADIIRRELAVTEDEQVVARAGFLLRLGVLYHDKLAQAETAIDLYRQVLELDPYSDDARARLEGWLGDDAHKTNVASILLPVYVTLENWPRQVECLEIQLAAEELSSQQVALLQRIGAILAGPMGDSTRAFEAFSRAFRVDPENPETQSELEKIAALEGRYADLAALYEGAVAGDLASSLLRRLLMKLADLYDDRLGEPEKATDYYKRALDVDPDNVEALDALEKLYGRAQNWGELLDVYRNKVVLSGDVDQRQELRFRIAHIQDEMLGQPTEAITTYNEILADDYENMRALVALDRLYVGQQMWIELSENLERQLTMAQDVEQLITLNLRLGELRLSRLEQASLAAENYRRVLEFDPANEAALAAMEQLLDNEAEQLGVARILEPIYRTANQWPRLIQTYEIMVKHSQEPAEKIALLHRIGELHEIIGDEQAAFSALGRAFKVDPANPDSQGRLENLARQMGAYADLVALYEDAIPDIVDDQLAISILFKVAQIFEGVLDSPAQAAAAYDRILGIDPASFPAVDALIELHRRTNNFDALVGAVVRKSDMVESMDDRKALLLYAANVRETVMESPAGAIELYQQVLSIDPSDLAALEALEKLYTQTESWEPLKDVYRRRVELADDPEVQRGFLHVLGQVYEYRLSDFERSMETYEQVLALEPNDYQAMEALDRLYGQAERWPDQLQILERMVELNQAREEQIAFRHRIGSLWEEKLLDIVRAVESYSDVLRIAADHGPTIAALDRIVHGENEPMLAAEVLGPLYDQLAEWEKLVDIYEVMATHTEDPLAKIERLHQIASIYERQLGAFDKAFDAYARALALEPTHEETLDQLNRLAEVTSEWEGLSKLFAEIGENVLDPTVKVDMYLRGALIFELRLDQIEDAIGRYLAVLELEPENEAAIRELDRVFTGLERWSDLIDILRRQIESSDDENQAIEHQYRMAQIYQMNLADLPHAIEVYREILNINPDHAQTLGSLELIFAEGEHQQEIAEILEPLYYAAERWEALVKLGEVKLGVTAEPADRLSIIQNVAEICERRLGDPGQAYFWWLRAYMEDPLNEQVCEEMTRLAEVTQEWGYIVEMGEQVLEIPEQSAEVRLAVLARSGRVLDKHLQDASRAIDAYRKVLELKGDHAEALAALDRIYTQSAMWDDLVEILQTRIENTMDNEVLIDLHMRLATALERYLGRPEEAIAAYNQVLELEPSSRGALEQLEALFLSHYRWQELFDNYQRMVDIANTDEDMAECYQRMAKIASECLARELDAVDLWGRVLDLRGEDALALGELAILHETASRWEELVEVLERQVYVLEDPEEKVRVYQALGRTYGERLGSERKSIDAWLSALDLDDHNVDTLYALHSIYERNESWVELTDILRRLIAVGPGILGIEPIRDYYAQLGRIEGEYLMQTDAAIDAWLRVLDLDPANMEAMAALEQLYTSQGRWQDVIRVLERKSRTVEDNISKIDILMQIAGIWEENLDDKIQASGAYLEILEIDSLHMAAGQALENIYRDTQDWGALTELLISRAEISPEPQVKVNSLQAAAKVFETEIGDLDNAFVVLQAAFNVDYANEDTSRELERLATVAGKWGDLLNEYNGIVTQIADPMEQCELWVKIGRWYGEHLNRPDYGIQSLQKALLLNKESVNALRELASFYRRDNQAKELAETLERLVPLENDPDVKSRTLRNLAEVQEIGLGDIGASISSYRRVLEVDPDNVVALDSLARLYETQGAAQELVEILTRRADLMLDDPSGAIVLRKRVGQVQDTALQDPQSAISTYRDILAMEPTDRDALVALERLYLAGNQIPEYLEILEAQLDATNDVREQIEIYEKMARALVELANDQLRATEVLEKVILLDPDRDVTYRQLEDLYTKLEKWSELVETYRRHVDAAPDYRAKIELLTAMAVVYEKQIQDVDRAIETYSEVLELDPNHLDSAIKLSHLQERIEDWPAVIKTLEKLVSLARDPAMQVDHLTRMGQVLLGKLREPSAAEMRLTQALELDPGHVPALVGLAELYKSRNDWLKAARNLESAADYSKNKLEKTNLAAEAGFIYYEELDDREKATSLFAKVLELDPEHVRSGKILAQIYFDDRNFNGADPIFDMLTRKVEVLELDDRDQRDLFLRAAKVAREVGKGEKALKQYRRAYDIDPTDREVLSGMADLLFERQDWDKAFKLYQTILVQHRDSQSPKDTVLVYYRLGTIKRHQNEARKALNYLEKALEIDPHDKSTLEAVIELQTSSNDWEGVIQAKRALIDTLDEDGKVAIYKEIGKLYTEKLNNWRKATQAYQSALELRPTDYPLLHTLLDIYTRQKQWDDTIRIIDKIVVIEKDGVRRSRYHYTAAVVLRDEVNAHDEAIDRFNMVLDDDPSFLKAFQAIDAMVTKSKDWKTLERSYRKMLKRLPQGDEELQLKITLWSNLAEIYRTRLNDFKAATAAFEVANKLDPENVDRHYMLAELYERLLEDHPNDYVTQAVSQHQILIAREPFRYESYHALFKIYSRSKQIDKAYCVARTLAFLKQANGEEQALFERYHSQEWQQARQRLSEETLRRNVFPEEEDAYLTGILGMIAPALAAWQAKPLPPAFKNGDRVDISVDPQLISRMGKYVMSVLNVGQPDVYLRADETGDLMLMNCVREGRVLPTMVVFQNLLKGKNEKHLAFALGRHMLDLYLPHYAYVCLDRSPQRLKQIFMTCMHICGMPVQGNAAELNTYAREIVGRLPAGAIDQMRSMMRKFVEAGGSADVKKWAQATEIAGYRVGLLLCNDIVVAAHVISQESATFGATMTPKDKIKELVLYSLSEDYFKARKSIGLVVA
ncbi:MAG: tetratricopeptide repeat protein [Nannocystaceae bacterium]